MASLDAFPGLRQLQYIYECGTNTCTRCDLSKSRRRVMFGYGWSEAPDIAFIGERPTLVEELEDVLYAGERAALLHKGLGALQLDAKRMYYMHAVCCKPPAKRLPTPVELQKCKPIMESQIIAIQPQIVMCLGELAAQSLLETDSKLPEMRSKWHKWLEFDVRVTYALDQVVDGGEHEKTEFWIDLQSVKARLEEKA